MIEVGSRVIVPPYSIQDDLSKSVLEAEEHHRIGTIDRILEDGQIGPSAKRWCFVVLDEALGNNDVRQCDASQLVEMEP